MFKIIKIFLKHNYNKSRVYYLHIAEISITCIALVNGNRHYFLIHYFLIKTIVYLAFLLKSVLFSLLYAYYWSKNSIFWISHRFRNCRCILQASLKRISRASTFALQWNITWHSSSTSPSLHTRHSLSFL